MAHFVSRLRFAGNLARRLVKPLPDPILPFDPDAGTHFYALGTSGSAPSFDNRQTSSYLLTVDDKRLLIDAGTGLFMNYPRNRDPMEEIDQILLTHLHPDHVTDLDQFVVASIFAVRGRFMQGRRNERGELITPNEKIYPKKTIIGPAETERYLLSRLNPERIHEAIEEVRRQGIEIPDPPEHALLSPQLLDEAFDFRPLTFIPPDLATDKTHEELSLLGGAVALRAYPVDHISGSDKMPAFGFRFEVKNPEGPPTIIAMSGDTSDHPVLGEICAGADLAVMDMAGPPIHLTSEEAAKIATRTGVTVLAGTHFMPWDRKGPPMWHREQVAPHFAGRVEMLVPGTVMTVKPGNVGKPLWTQTGMPLTRYEQKVFDTGHEPRMAQYIPRGAERRSYGLIPRDPATMRAAKSTRQFQLWSVVKLRF